MTQITGKIYQQTNAAGTENRFPRTVMEAVLGLNSYLQDQFGALADIYMPIDGISESKPNQEFVYRKTPNTIKAKALTLDKIKGKSLAWNQYIQEVHVQGVTISASTSYAITANGIKFLNGHKYMLRQSGLPAGTFIQTDGVIGLARVTSDETAYIATMRDDNSVTLNPYVYNASQSAVTIDNAYFGFTDLTILYGSEIDGMTDAEILAKFESEYPGYHAYNPGTLISNDAESLETVGFNLFNESTLVANKYIDVDGGVYIDSQNRCASPDYFPCIPNTDYYVTRFVNGVETLSGYLQNVYFYDSNKNPIRGYSAGGVVTSPSNAHFFRFASAEPISSTTKYCINLSNSSRNGQYEPYKKSVCPLNLKTRRGKLNGQGASVVVFLDGMNGVGTSFDEANRTKGTKRRARVNLGDLEWTKNWGGQLGYFSASPDSIKYVNGSNDIVCSKYASTFPWSNDDSITHVYDRVFIKDSAYDSADAAAFKAAMDGVYLDYELAEPQEYVWDEPLPTSMPAGTTEARISPNADGLSAPFCADITYGMGASDYATDAEYASYAGNAQYAEVAARLLTPRTIWGQVFDGSANITGAMTGVSSIDSLMYFDTSNGRIGIGTTTPSYSLDVAGTFHAAGNSEIGGNLSVLGEVTVPQYAGLNFAGSSDVWLASLGIDQYGSDLILSFGADDDHVLLHDGNYGSYMIPLSEGIASNSARLDSMEDWLSNPRLSSLVADRLDSDEISVGALTATSLVCAALSGVGNINSKIYFSGSNVGIANSSPSYGLDVAGTFRATGNSVFGGTIDAVYGRALLHSIESSPVEWDTEATPVVEVQPFQVTDEGEATFMQVKTRNGLVLQDYDSDGHEFHSASLDYSYDGDTVTCNKSITAPSFIQSSDQRLKTDLAPVALTVEQIASAPAVEFNWIGNGQRGAGSIAQYWENTLPYNVHHSGETLTMEYGNIALLSAITCAREIQKLEKRIEELEAKLNQ